MALLDDIKVAMRIETADFDSELNDLIAAAQADLKLSGVDPVKAGDPSDPLVKRAITTYVKAHFGWDNLDHERLVRAYDMLKGHLTLSQEYRVGGGEGE